MPPCHTPGCNNPAPYFVVDGSENYHLCRACVSAMVEGLRDKSNKEHSE